MHLLLLTAMVLFNFSLVLIDCHLFLLNQSLASRSVIWFLVYSFYPTWQTSNRTLSATLLLHWSPCYSLQALNFLELYKSPVISHPNLHISATLQITNLAHLELPVFIWILVAFILGHFPSSFSWMMSFSLWFNKEASFLLFWTWTVSLSRQVVEIINK